MQQESDEDYRRVLKDRLSELKRDVTKSNISAQVMAETCRIDKTYLSHVLNGRAHFSDDQLHLACTYLNLSGVHREYVELLHECQRTGLESRRVELTAKLGKVRARRAQSEGYINATRAIEELESLNAYYLDPMVQVVHIFMTIEHFSRHPDEIAAKVGIDPARLQAILDKLESVGIVERGTDGQYNCQEFGLHLNETSPIFPAQRLLTRLNALERLRHNGGNGGYNFAAIFSADEATFLSIKLKFLEFLKSIEPEVRAAPARNVYQLNFDLINWGGD